MAKNDDVSANVKTNKKSNLAISAFDTLVNVCKEELELITLNPMITCSRYGQIHSKHLSFWQG